MVKNKETPEDRRERLRKAGSRGGLARGGKKGEASARNGKKGGRPRKVIE